MSMFRRRMLMTQPTGPKAELLRIDEAEVSMLCIDGTDGKNNAFQLSPVTTEGTFAPVWESSNPLIATVDSSGVVRGVSVLGASLGANVVISCMWQGVTKTCLFTVYGTMPSSDVDEQGLWLCKGGSGPSTSGPQVLTCVFVSPTPMTLDLNSVHTVSQFTVPSNYLTPFGGLVSTLGRMYLPSVYSSTTGHNPRFRMLNGSTATDHRLLISRVEGTSTIDRVKYGTDGVTLNGIPYSPVFDGTFARTGAPYTELRFYTSIKKITSYGRGVNLPKSLLSQINCAEWYVPQNYVRYANHDTYVNRTKILNIGTLGSNYDLEANNVPELWYGV